jgi:hypothetical protein
MIGLPERLVEYTQARGAGVAHADAQELLLRALQRVHRAPAAGRHWRNGASALALVALIAGSVVLLQLRSTSVRVPVKSPTITLPDEVIELSIGEEVQAFNIRERRLSPAQSAWMVADHARLVITPANDCGQTVLQVVDPANGNDQRPPIRLSGCYRSGPVLLRLSDGTVFLERYTLLGAVTDQSRAAVSLGLDRYDWRAGRVIQSYSVAFLRDLVLAPDEEHVYALTATVTTVFDCPDPSPNCPSIIQDRIERLDLRSGTITGHFDAGSHTRFDLGADHRMAASADGRSLFVNELSELLIFDTQTPGPAAVVPLNGPQATRTEWQWPSMLVTAEAKELPGKSIAIDPKGRWVAVLGAPSPRSPYGPADGIWLVSTTGTAHVVAQLHAHDGFRAIASSLDGNTLYLLEVAGGGRYLLVVDPLTGKDLNDVLVCPGTSCQGFDGIAGVLPAGQ